MSYAIDIKTQRIDHPGIQRMQLGRLARKSTAIVMLASNMLPDLDVYDNIRHQGLMLWQLP